MVCRERCVLFYRCATLLLICCCLAAQSALPNSKALELRQTRYALTIGEPVPIAASGETLDFLRQAKTRRIEMGGAKAGGLVVGPNRAGQMVLAASPGAQPGEYAVTVSATNAAGEERQTTLTVAVNATATVPSGATRNPVVLLNGWEEGFNNACPISNNSSDTFGNLAQYLVADGVPVVYLFDNCLLDPNQPIETLGNDLATFLNSIRYDTGAQVQHIDLVAFSLGGLIARAYLAGLQPTEALAPPINTLVGKLVLIASPNFGSFVAGNNNAVAISSGTQSAELVPGSSLQWNLATWNQLTDDLRGVNAIAVIGNAGTYTPVLGSSTVLNNASDGIVSLTSGSIGFVTQQAAVTRIVPYCHVDPSAFINTTLGTFGCDAPGIANVTSESHYTSQIVRSFLAGTSDWSSIGSTPATDPYLSTTGGTFFGLVSQKDSYASDLSQVAWGTLQMVNGGDIGTIFYDDFVSGTGVFEATSASLGTLNCGSYKQPAGFFSAERCKVDTAIFSVGPLVSAFPKVVSAGGAISLTGSNFGSRCTGCQVTGSLAGASAAQILQVNSWTNTAITVVLPASFAGFSILTVYAVAGTDAIAIMSALPNPSIIGGSPASLQFGYTTGGTVPAAQSIQITNSGGGTLAWTATASASWLSVSPASGTAPSTLSVSVSTAGLSAGTYNGNIQISSSGASDTPLSVPVTLTVTQASPILAIAPQSLTFSYTVGGSVPAAQTVSITNAGAGTLSWTTSSSNYWVAVSPASGSAPGTLSISINPANLPAGTYTSAIEITAAGASGSPASLGVTLVVQGTQPAGIITAVANAGSFAAGAASATWLAIFGSNLSTSTYTWQAADFVNGNLPTSLQGVSVTINGLPAYVQYISPTQVNVLAPDDATIGPVAVQVTAALQASNSLSVQKTQFLPAFFTIDGGKYVAALHLDYSLVGSSNLLPGVTTRPAQPGETILLYGTGFGPTNPPLPTGQLIATPSALANSVQVSIGGAVASVTYAGLVEPGTYQFNVTVPNLPNGDAAVVASIGGVTSQTGVAVTVHQ